MLAVGLQAVHYTLPFIQLHIPLSDLSPWADKKRPRIGPGCFFNGNEYATAVYLESKGILFNMGCPCHRNYVLRGPTKYVWSNINWNDEEHLKYLGTLERKKETKYISSQLQTSFAFTSVFPLETA